VSSDRVAAAQLQMAATQAVLAIARRDHRDEQVNRLWNLLYQHLHASLVGLDFDRARAALEAGVLAADRELAEPKPTRDPRAAEGHEKAVRRAEKMIESGYARRVRVANEREATVWLEEAEQMALDEGAADRELSAGPTTGGRG
jgi:hypothetical protein